MLLSTLCINDVLYMNLDDDIMYYLQLCIIIIIIIMICGA